MNELLQQSILDAFSEIQKWNQQFIIDDAGNSVDLASATLGQQSTTPLLASNQPTTFPHRSVYRFDATRYKGMDSFSSLVLMIQNSLPRGTLFICAWFPKESFCALLLSSSLTPKKGHGADPCFRRRKLYTKWSEERVHKAKEIQKWIC